MTETLQILANQVAPILVQLAVAALVARLVLLTPKLHAFLDEHITPAQQTMLATLSESAVHFAEAQGAGQAGAAKLKVACDFADSRLRAAGITSVTAGDIIAAVQKAWADSAYTYKHAEKPAAPTAVITSSGMTTVARGPNIGDVVVTTEAPPAPVESPPVVDAPVPTV